MSKTTKYNFPDAKRGDTYNDVSFTINVNGSAQDLTGAAIRMWLIDASQQIPAGDFNTVNGKLIITNAAAGVFKTNIGIVTLQPAQYYYDIQITFTNGTIKTWIEGTLTVLDDLTK